MSRFHKIELFGKPFLTDPDDALELATNGIYEPYESSLIAETCRGKICLDVGAHIGYYTCLMLNAGAKQVHAYEPNPLNYVFLDLNTVYYENVKLNQHALSNADERSTMALSPINSGDDMLFPPDNLDRLIIPIVVQSYDNLYAQVNRIYVAHYGGFGFCKIDVQGMELKVLQGMEHEISRGDPMTIALEYYGDGMRAAGVDGKDVLGFLWLHGFKLFEIKEGEKRLAPIEDMGFADREDLVHGYTNIWAERK